MTQFLKQHNVQFVSGQWVKDLTTISKNSEQVEAADTDIIDRKKQRFSITTDRGLSFQVRFVRAYLLLFNRLTWHMYAQDQYQTRNMQGGTLVML